MSVIVACLGYYSAERVLAFFEPRHDVRVRVAPPHPAPAGAVREVVAGADLVIADASHRTRLTRPLLEAMPGCRLVQVPSAGYESVDHRAAAELGIPVANCAGCNRHSVADWTVMAILDVLRRGSTYDRRMRDLRQGPWPVPEGGRELRHLTCGIVGMGNVGMAVARRLAGFGCRVVFADAVPKTFDGAEQVPLERLLEESDVVCVHVPLEDDTRALIDARALGRMRRGGVLVNAARGPVVDERALVDALRSGHLWGAALDVFETEPLPSDSPLRSLENVLLSPHAAGNTIDVVAEVDELVRANLVRALEGQPPLNVVNRPVAAS